MIRYSKSRQVILAGIATITIASNLAGAVSQDTRKIETLDDLKAAINSPSSLATIRDMDSWLPGLVSSLQWKTRMSDHFIMHYYVDAPDEEDVIFDSFCAESEEIYRQLEKFFHIEPASKQDVTAMLMKLSCFVVKTRTERTFGSFTNPHVLFYMMDPKDDPDYMVRFRHEYAHWVWFRMYGAAPSLFHEGLAVYAEKMSGPNADIAEFLSHGLTLNDIPPLKEIAFNKNFWKQDQGKMYTAGSLLIHFLVEKYGWERLKQFCLLTDFQDPDVLERFEQAYGCSLESIDSEWREFLRCGERGN